jgi:hypothetical protein
MQSPASLDRPLAMEAGGNPLQLQSVRQAYESVTYRVNVALRTQRGDQQHLYAEREEVLLFFDQAQQVGTSH